MGETEGASRFLCIDTAEKGKADGYHFLTRLRTSPPACLVFAVAISILPAALHFMFAFNGSKRRGVKKKKRKEKRRGDWYIEI